MLRVYSQLQSYFGNHNTLHYLHSIYSFQHAKTKLNWTLCVFAVENELRNFYMLAIIPIKKYQLALLVLHVQRK